MNGNSKSSFPEVSEAESLQRMANNKESFNNDHLKAESFQMHFQGPAILQVNSIDSSSAFWNRKCEVRSQASLAEDVEVGIFQRYVLRRPSYKGHTLLYEIISKTLL